MASITGSQNASAAAIGSISIGAMKKDGYEDGFSVAVIASSGGLGPIIPPSIIMVIYCTTAGNVSEVYGFWHKNKKSSKKHAELR